VPATVACWRFLRRHVANVPAVHLQKWDLMGAIPSRLTIEGEHYLIERFPAGTPALPEDPEGPLFIANGSDANRLDPLLDLLCGDGPVLDAIEALSWLFLKTTVTRERLHSGIIRPEDLPPLQQAQCESIANLLLNGSIVRTGEGGDVP
jgi:hypothetical protein